MQFIATRCQMEEDPVEMRVEVKRVDVEGFSLIRKHDQNHLNGVQTLAVFQLPVGY